MITGKHGTSRHLHIHYITNARYRKCRGKDSATRPTVLSLPGPLLYVSFWNVWRDSTRKSWMKPTLPCIHRLRFLVAEQPRSQSSWLQNLGQNSATRKSAGSERFEAASDSCAGWMEQNVIDDVSNQWCRRLHACIRVSGIILIIHCDKRC